MKTKKAYKTVILPVTVPDSDYCWRKGQMVCPYLDTFKNPIKCNLGFCGVHFNENGVILKPESCLNLKPESKPKKN